MKLLLLILALQTPLEWKVIKEMSGNIPNHPGLTVVTSATQIKRSEYTTKLLLRADFPYGAPIDVFRDSAPHGFDVSSIVRMEAHVELDCRSNKITPTGGAGYLYQFNGKKIKSKEPPFNVSDGHIFAEYFCEKGTKPTTRPTLKP